MKYLKRYSPNRVSDIAGEMRIPVFKATRLIDQLEQMKYIKRTRDKDDRRNIMVEIERKGLEKVKEMEENSFEIVRSNLLMFDEDEIRSLVFTAENIGKIMSVKLPELE